MRHLFTILATGAALPAVAQDVPILPVFDATAFATPGENPLFVASGSRTAMRRLPSWSAGHDNPKQDTSRSGPPSPRRRGTSSASV